MFYNFIFASKNNQTIYEKNKKKFFRDLHDLLERWPRVPVECALQLLDQSYPDQRVHDFAVQSLR